MKYEERAVVSLRDHLKVNLGAALAAVELDRGFTAGTLREPAAYVMANAPMDTRSPLVEMWCEVSDPVNYATGSNVWLYDLSCAISIVGDADIERTVARVYQYSEAIYSAIRADPTLGGTVASALVKKKSFDVFRGPKDITRHIALVSVEIRILED
ncbi:MAG: hypothetical protein CMF70_07005 [Magnetovibrio sp.]|nr:hypothetical protein [Magnetovibrio sp.]